MFELKRCRRILKRREKLWFIGSVVGDGERPREREPKKNDRVN